MSAFVVGRQIWPLPPVARITFLASKSSIEPVLTFRVTAPTHSPCVVDRERGREVLLVAVDRVRVLHQLLVEDVHDRLARDVGDVVGAGGRGAAEGAGAEVALVVAVEGDAEVLEVDDLLGRLAAHDLDRVLVAQVVGALDRVEGVRLPRVVGVERGVDPALRSVRVRAHGMDLRDDPDRHARLGGSKRRPLPGQSCSYDEYVVTRHPSAGLYSTSEASNPTFALGIERSEQPVVTD